MICRDIQIRCILGVKFTNNYAFYLYVRFNIKDQLYTKLKKINFTTTVKEELDSIIIIKDKFTLINPPDSLSRLLDDPKSNEISQYGSTVVEIPPQFWQVTSDCKPPVKIRSIMQLQLPD